MADKPFHWPGQRADDPAHEMLAAFLVMDIQRNPDWASEIAERANAVKSGKLPVWERLGNAYRLEITAKGALIEDLVDEDVPVQTVSLGEFSKAITAWIEDMAHQR